METFTFFSKDVVDHRSPSVWEAVRYENSTGRRPLPNHEDDPIDTHHHHRHSHSHHQCLVASHSHHHHYLFRLYGTTPKTTKKRDLKEKTASSLPRHADTRLAHDVRKKTKPKRRRKTIDVDDAVSGDADDARGGLCPPPPPPPVVPCGGDARSGSDDANGKTHTPKWKRERRVALPRRSTAVWDIGDRFHPSLAHSLPLPGGGRGGGADAPLLPTFRPPPPSPPPLPVLLLFFVVVGHSVKKNSSLGGTPLLLSPLPRHVKAGGGWCGRLGPPLRLSTARGGRVVVVRLSRGQLARHPRRMS